jgi:uncharacterized protein
MKYLSVILSFIIFSNLGINAISQDIPEPLKPPQMVNDFADFLSVNEKNALEQKLVNFDKQTTTQIVIVTVKSLNGYDKADFAVRLAEKWGVGQKGKDNGIVILIKPKTQREKGEVFIASGYGLEAVVPDAIAKRIVENEIKPNFEHEKYYTGLDAATNTLISLTKGEFTAEQYDKSTRGSSKRYSYLGFIILFIIISIIGHIRRARHYSMGHNLPFWVAMGMMSSMGRSSGGSFGNFSSGSGGFGGLGGGSFGGGGAGGSW